MGLGPGLLLQVLADSCIVVFLLLSPAKEQYFIPGKRVGGTKASLVGMVAVGGQAGGLGWHRLLGACPGPLSPCPHPLMAGTEDYQLNSECNSDVICPHKCRCEASVVECSSLKLTKIPERIPQSTAEL